VPTAALLTIVNYYEEEHTLPSCSALVSEYPYPSTYPQLEETLAHNWEATKPACDWLVAASLSSGSSTNSSPYASIIGFGHGSIQGLVFATITAFPLPDVPKTHAFSSDVGTGILRPLVASAQPSSSTNIAGKDPRSTGQQTKC